MCSLQSLHWHVLAGMAIRCSWVVKLIWKRDKGRDFSSFSQWRHWKERVKSNYLQSSAWEENYWEECWMQRVGWEWRSQTRGMLENPILSFSLLPAFNCAILKKVFPFFHCKISLNWFDCHIPLQSYSGCLVLFLILGLWWVLFQLPADMTSGVFASPADVAHNSQKVSEARTTNLGFQDELVVQI